MSATFLLPPNAVPPSGRHAIVIGSVVLLHGVALWALNQGLQRAPAALVVPAQILAEFIAPPPPPPAPAPEPAVEPAKPLPVRPPPPRPRRPTVRPAPKPAPAPQPLAVERAAPAAPVMTAAPPAPPEPAPVVAESAPAPAATPAPPVIVQPSSSASHLYNPPPSYPSMSRRLGEAGRVVVRVLIGPDGRAREARIQRSSGFDRLDQVALQTARDRWRYVPGTRNGVPEPMWFNIPINFVLE